MAFLIADSSALTNGMNKKQRNNPVSWAIVFIGISDLKLEVM